MNQSDGVWLSITDYSQYKKISISTVRRQIKNQFVKYKEQEGKYFIYVSHQQKITQSEEGIILKLRLELEEIREKLKQIEEENHELKMLVDLYENNKTHHLINLPELPEI